MHVRILTLSGLTAALQICISLAGAQPYAYVTNLSGNNVSVVNTANSAVTASISVQGGPTGIVVSPDGSSVYVASQSANVVSAIDTSNNSVVATMNTGSTPSQLAITPNGSQVYVVDQGSDQVSIIDTSSKSVVLTLGVGSRPNNIAISPDGSRAFVTNLWSANVSVIDTRLRAVVATFSTASGPSGVAVNPDGRTLYVANQYAGVITVHDAASGNILNTIGGFAFPNWVAISPSGSRIFVSNANSGTVSVIDAASQTVVATIPVGLIPTSVAISADGTRAFVTNEYGFSLSVIDIGSNSVLGTISRVGVYPVVVAVAPGPARIVCTAAVNPVSSSFAQTGGMGTISVSAPSGCSWTAASNAGWMSITSGSNGIGSGTVAYSVSPNGSASSLTGSLTIGGQTFTVTELGMSCSYSLSASSASLSASGGYGAVGITAPATCAWSASSDSAWLSVASSSGTGNTTLGFIAGANPNTTSRTANLSIGGQGFSVTQAGTGFTPIRVNCGGPALTDANGNFWSADYQRNLSATNAAIANTGIPEMYQKESWSNSTLQYQFKVPNGSYTVKLRFAEFYMSQRGQRMFNIVLNGSLVYQNFDILAFTNPNTAYDMTFPVDVNNGQIVVQLVPMLGPAKISGLEIY